MRLRDYKWVCIALAILCITLWITPLKKPIENATYEELTEEIGIGKHRATLVLQSGCKDVEDLYMIDGIGEKTVYKLKQKYY